MTPENHEVLIAVIGAIGGIIIAFAMIRKNKADARSKEKENETNAGQLALEMVKELKKQLDCLEAKGIEWQKKITEMQNLLKKKDKRIDELEAKTIDQDRQLLILRKLNQEKDLVIEELKTRLEAVEKSKGSGCVEAE